MPIDASIYGNVGRFKSATDFDAEANARDLSALQLLTAQRGIAKEDRALADQTALRQLVGTFGADDAANVQSLYRAGRLPEAQAYQKAIGDAAKVKAETGYKTAETAKLTEEQARAKRHEAIQHIGAMSDPGQAMQSLAASKDVPEEARGPLMAQLQAIKTPQEFREWQLRTVLALASPEQQAKAMMPKTEQQNLGATMRTISIDPLTGKPTVADEAKIAESANNVANNARIAAEGAANRGVQMRGQNMTDARSRESNAASLTKPFEVTGSDGLPVLVQQDKQGNITPVQGFGPKSGSAKPLTEGQSKALLFGTRAQESDKIIEELAGKGVKGPSMAQQMTGGTGITGRLATAVATPQQQQAEQAQRDFINAVLRRESGAVISPGEFDNARLQYFVQPGDSKEVIAQKARNRQLAKDGILAEVPEGRRASITPKPAPAADADIDALLKKYAK